MFRLLIVLVALFFSFLKPAEARDEGANGASHYEQEPLLTDDRSGAAALKVYWKGGLLDSRCCRQCQSRPDMLAYSLRLGSENTTQW